MNEATPPIGPDDLHAYVDNQLDADRRSLVDQYLKTDPDASERVADYQAQRDSIRAAFQSGGERPLPPNLTLDGLLAWRVRSQVRQRWLAAASILLALGVGGAGGWLLHAAPWGRAGGRMQQAMTVLEQEAITSHAVYSVDVRHPVEVAATEEAHLQQWLSNRLHRPVIVPQLSSLGYHLIGGRLLATEHGNPAAMLMYEDGAHQRITVLFRPMGSGLQVAAAPIAKDGLNGQAWIDGGLGVAVVAALPEGSITPVAQQISSALGSPS